ncbi:MAG TPA: hypothetical protein VKQ30_24485 [Ktedonobacterales bacterium]|nr:hypothetical protein [Ktedonobacterales bacterium]
MERDEDGLWKQRGQGARTDGGASGGRTQVGLPEAGEHAFFGRIVESVPLRLPTNSRQRLVVGMCAVLLVAVVLGAVLASVHARGGTSASQGHISGNGAASGGRGTPSGAQPLQLPPGIPHYFSFGVMNAPGGVTLLDDMRTHNGTAWDYRYQYLTGGVNTGHGWETWNSPTGAFASYYMRESASHHYIPAFVYYELCYSSGSCPPDTQSDTDLANLNTPSVMSAYFANWRLLMREIGSFGGPTLVVVEPDLWGFMQRAALAKGNVPAAVPASVASSGDADVGSLPNNGQGYAWALLHIRDLYAPNAVLALDVSYWSTGADLGTSTDPNLDVNGIMQQTAQFVQGAGLNGNPAGISAWDLISSDVSDRDSGQGSAWWDPTNTLFPNFSRYLSFISGFTRATGKKVVMWQVPEGNQYFDTENNTPHHTQDNRATYILGHVADFARAGVIGVLFGPGNGGTTINDDAHDGVTNPSPIAGFQCDLCNTHISVYPDDDGGYLRLFVGAYYRHGPLSLANPGAWTPPGPPDASATVTPAPQGACVGAPVVSIGGTSATPNPVKAGQPVAITTYVTISCDLTALVYIEVSNPGDRVMQLSQDNVAFSAGQAQKVTLSGVIPAGTTPGTYGVTVVVYQAGWGAEYFRDYSATKIGVQ